MVGKIRATLVELYNRTIDVDKNEKNIYLNGDDNLYPYGIERVINNSPTAKRACDLLHRYIAGRGVEDDRIVNANKGYYLSDIVDMIAGDVSPQSGAFVWIGYGVNENLELYQKTLDVLDYSNCRISKEDGNEAKGKIYVKDYSKKSGMFQTRKNENTTWYYPYNPNPEIVSAQMRADARKVLELDKDDEVDIKDMIRFYRGQVMYINTTPRYKYALSRFDSVFNDADSEFRFSLYVNKEFRTGFLGKLIVLTQGIDDDKANQVSEDLGKLLGAENSGSMYHLDFAQVENINNVLKVEQLKAQFDDKLFTENDKRIRRNILGAANNLPELMIYAGDGMFDGSGEKYREMKAFFNEQTQRERRIIEKALLRAGFPTKIIPIIEEENGNTNEE